MSEQATAPTQPGQDLRDAGVIWTLPQEAIESIAKSIALQFGGRLSCIETKVASLASAARVGENSAEVKEDCGEECNSLGEEKFC